MHVCVMHVCVVHVCVVHVCVVHVCGACVCDACVCGACVCGACVCGACGTHCNAYAAGAVCMLFACRRLKKQRQTWEPGEWMLASGL